MKKHLYILIINCSLLITHCYSQWIQLPNLPVTGTVYDMYFVNANTGWMTLTSPKLLIKTTDGGQSWNTQITGGTTGYYYLRFFDSNTGIVLAQTSSLISQIYRTTNSGSNWNLIFSTNDIFIHMNFINNDTGWVCGENGNFMRRIWRTTDGGVSFQVQHNIGGGSFERIVMLKEKVNGEYWGWCYAGLNLLRTTNSGVNWVQIATLNGACGSIQDMVFADTANGVLVRGSGCINKTSDGGINWLTLSEVNVSNGCRISMANQNTGWITMAADSIIKTTNFFQTYGKQILPAIGIKIFAVDTLNVFAGLNQTNMIKTTNGGGNIVSVNIISTEIPGEFALYQNYPNPFNPVTNIRYAVKRQTSKLPGQSSVKLIVFDLLGREVEILLNRKQQAGTYEVIWDASAHPSGTYFYKLTTEDNTETKKMVLIK